MSVLVKGMKMPKSCGKCFVGNREICVNGCPLVPVPPHGDLIDIGTVKENLVKDLQNHTYRPSWNDAVIAMLSAPTIIQEEPESPNGER